MLIVLVIIIALIGSCFGGDEDQPAPVEEKLTEEIDVNQDEMTDESEADLDDEMNEEQERNIPGTLGYGVDEFAERYNAAASEVDVTWRISNVDVTEGEVQNVFQHRITDNVYVMGTINKADDSLRDVSLIGAGDGTEQSGHDILFNIGLLIMATNPELDADERGSIMDGLGFLDNASTDFEGETTYEGLHYSISVSEMIGVMFYIQDEHDQGL
ncbi:hypothetical protein N0O92_22180 [Alkalihalobacillus sp. MEB130]|uniref:hypothetical protein n=1 Tax=Alkalihalobacillus sp. MEB130 TaxID=2976704 RepID=UPI0028DE9FC6|nr:hypothetical protein [Alkalihalobacillus sp. MEB130]MDT8862885.1 hypothetical protein [Alkalihalobacillus sp. MEB130]